MDNVGEREVVLALAIFLPLGALLLGYCGGRSMVLENGTAHLKRAKIRKRQADFYRKFSLYRLSCLFLVALY